MASAKVSSEIWWTPNHPFKSGLTGQSCRDLTDAYTKATGRPWTQPIGFQHALFEVAIDVLKRAKDIDSPEAIRDAIPQTKLDTIIGHVQWGNGPVKNVAKTPLVGGQWVKGKNHPYDLLVVNNETAPEISSTFPYRPSGTNAVICFANSLSAGFKSVSIGPGCTVLTRMLRGARSFAQPRANAATAAFVAL